MQIAGTSITDDEPGPDEAHFSLEYLDAHFPPPEIMQLLMHRFLLQESWRFGRLSFPNPLD